jgi:hypothetical protein
MNHKKINCNNNPFVNSHSRNKLKNQANGAPRRYIINKGGSPSGVKSPPQFATIPIKNKIVWTLNSLSLFVWITGLIRSIAAPVVPINDASIAPIARKRVFMEGFASISPVRNIPPVMVKSDQVKL